MAKVGNNPVKSVATLPDGFEEFPDAIPRQARKLSADKKKVLGRFHWCSNCGWVEGAPVVDPSGVGPWPNQESRRPRTLWRCRKCNRKIAEVGDVYGGRQQGTI